MRNTDGQTALHQRTGLRFCTVGHSGLGAVDEAISPVVLFHWQASAKLNLLSRQWHRLRMHDRALAFFFEKFHDDRRHCFGAGNQK